MEWDVEYTNEFENWWNSLSEGEQKFIPVADKLYDEHLKEISKSPAHGAREGRNG